MSGLNSQPIYAHNTLEDACFQAEFQSWVPIECKQVSAGRYQGEMEVLDLGHETLIVKERQSQTVLKQGCMADEFCTVSTAMYYADHLRFSQFNQAEHLTEILFLPAGTPFDVMVPPNIETLYIRFHQQTLLDKLVDINPQLWSEPPKTLQVFKNPYQRSRFIHSVNVLTKLVNEQKIPINGADIDSMIQDAFLVLVDQAHESICGHAEMLHDNRRRMAVMRQATDYIEAELQVGNLPTVSGLCHALNLSLRSLQYYFMQHFSLSPVVYMRVERLNRARQDLINHAQQKSVTEIATRWGFVHLSAFARDYAQLFAEKPSETKARYR